MNTLNLADATDLLLDGKEVVSLVQDGTILWEKVTSGPRWVRVDYAGNCPGQGQYIWQVSGHTYYSYGVQQYELINGVWVEKTWSNVYNFEGNKIWSAPDGAYYSTSQASRTDIYKYDPATENWSLSSHGVNAAKYSGTKEKSWQADTSYYYSYGTKQRVWTDSGWSTYNWGDFVPYDGENIWHLGTRIFYSEGTTHKELMPHGWQDVYWKGKAEFEGRYIATVGDAAFIIGIESYKLNGDTWEYVNLSNPITYYSKYNAWTLDGHFYFTMGGNTFELVE